MKKLLKSYESINSLRGELKDVEVRINGYKRQKQLTSNQAKKNELDVLIYDQESRQAKLLKQVTKAQAIIDAADINERDRRMLTLRYIDCLSWQDVAFRMGVHDEQLPRRWHKELFEIKKTTKKTKKNK